MNIQHMRGLVAIKECGNISRAARSLYLSQPALSRHLKEMEKELGAKLVERDTHGVTFTEVGEKACRSFRQILRTYDRLAQDIEGYRKGLTGSLRIGMLYYTIREDFGDAMERFVERYPNVELRRFSYQPQEVFQALAEERIDVGVMSRADYRDGAFLRYQDISHTGLAALMSADHPLAARKALALDDLRGQQTVILRDDPYSNECYAQALGRCGFVQQRVTHTDNIDTVPFELRKADSLYIVPQGLVLPGFGQELVAVPIEAPGLRVTKSFAWREDNDNPLVPLFLAVARG